LTDQSKFIVKPLEKEDRAAFQCGEEVLDSYFRERASRDMAHGLAAVLIVPLKDDPKTIAGFFTLSSQQIACDILPEQLRKRTGRRLLNRFFASNILRCGLKLTLQLAQK
jgi:hypothetical protein